MDIVSLTAQLNAALAAMQATVTSVPSVTTASVSVLATLSAQVATALGLAQQVLSYWDVQLQMIGSSGNFASGTAPATMIANVSSLQQATASICYAFDCVNKLGRLAKNIAAVQD